MGRDKTLAVKVEVPEKLQEQAIKAVWWDGARTGAIAGLLAGLVIGYLLWRKS